MRLGLGPYNGGAAMAHGFWTTLLLGGGDLDVWVRERQSRDDEFGPAVNVAGVNSPESEFPGWISPDNCRLYFDSGDVVRDLYVAERMP